MKKPKQKILMVAAVDFPPDPRIERAMLAASELGYDVSLLCLKGNGSRTWKKFRIFRLPFSEFESFLPKPFCWILDYLFFLLFGTLATYVLTIIYRFKIVHYHNPPDFNVIFLAPLKLLGVKLIYDAHEVTYILAQSRLPSSLVSTILIEILKFFQFLAIYTSDVTITVNAIAKNYLRKLCKKREIFIIENIPYPFSIPEENETPNTFIYAGALLKDRDISTLLEAFEKLQREHKNAHLWIVGGVRPLSTSSLNIKFFKKQPHDKALQLIAKASVVVLSAADNAVNRIGASNRAYEAAYMGKAIIAADLPGFKSILGNSCIYYTPGDINSLLEAMKFLINNKNVRIYNQKVKKHFAKHYSWDNIKFTFERIYGE